MSYKSTSADKDFILRGNKQFSAAGTLTFFGTRLLDPVLQYGILARNWGAPLITLMRGTTLPQGPPLITNSPFDRLGLSPYRSILFAMSVGSMVKQNYWVTALAQEKTTPAAGAMVGLFNAVGNTLNSLLFVCAQTSASNNGEHFPQTPLIVGSGLFVAGILIELVSEQQRYNWKKDAANKGQVYDGGLFALARHVNYFGYTLWRAGYALAAGGWIWGGMVGGLAAWQFITATIAVHEHYMEEKYGEKYVRYEQSVPYRLVPYLY